MTLSEIFIVFLIQYYATLHNVDPNFACAVAQVESGLKIGPLGKKGTYIGPMGIHKQFRNKWDIDNLETNIWVGVRALRGRNEKRVLQRYNTSFNMTYYKAVQKSKKSFKRRTQ